MLTDLNKKNRFRGFFILKRRALSDFYLKAKQAIWPAIFLLWHSQMHRQTRYP